MKNKNHKYWQQSIKLFLTTIITNMKNYMELNIFSRLDKISMRFNDFA